MRREEFTRSSHESASPLPLRGSKIRMKAIRFEQFGEPSEVLHLAEVPIPEPGLGEVRVRMIASPINPSDLLTVQGRYGVLPKLPAIPGYEGVGVVDKAGPGLIGKLLVGRRGGRPESGGRQLGRSTSRSRRSARSPSRPTSPTPRWPRSSSTRRPSWPWPGTS